MRYKLEGAGKYLAVGSTIRSRYDDTIRLQPNIGLSEIVEMWIDCVVLDAEPLRRMKILCLTQEIMKYSKALSYNLCMYTNLPQGGSGLFFYEESGVAVSA